MSEELSIDDLQTGDRVTLLNTDQYNGFVGAILEVGPIDPPFVLVDRIDGFRISNDDKKHWTAVDCRRSVFGSLSDDYINAKIASPG